MPDFDVDQFQRSGPIPFREGDRVAVRSGVFEGVYGRLVRIGGCWDRCRTAKSECHVFYVEALGGLGEEMKTHTWYYNSTENTVCVRVSELVHVD